MAQATLELSAQLPEAALVPDSLEMALTKITMG